MEQDEAVGGEDLADLEAGAVQRGGGSRSSAAGGASQAWRSSTGGWNFPGLEEQRRRVELPRRGGAAPAGGPSGGEEQSRRVQARRSRAGTGGAGRGEGRGEGRGDLQLAPSGTRSFQAASRSRRSRFFSPPYPFGSIWVAPSASAREIERARAAPSASAREIAGIGTASASAPPRAPPRRLRSA